VGQDVGGRDGLGLSADVSAFARAGALRATPRRPISAEMLKEAVVR
jgi:hypothetical protein